MPIWLWSPSDLSVGPDLPTGEEKELNLLPLDVFSRVIMVKNMLLAGAPSQTPLV